MKREFYPRLNEIVGNRYKYSGANSEKWEPAIKEAEKYILGLLTNSPVTFNHTQSDKGFIVSGPFDTYLRVEHEPEQQERQGYGSRPYKSAHYSILTSIGNKELNSAKELLGFLKSSIEVKQFIKGATVEKMREARIKKILKQPFSKESVLEYFEFANADVTPIKKDASGPWSTSGTSINGHTYDLEPMFQAWEEEGGKNSDDLQDGIEWRWKDDIIKLKGFKQNGICSSEVLKYEPKYDDGYATLYIEVKTHCYYN